MPHVIGEFISARPRTIDFKQGRRAGTSVASFQVAFIPKTDPHGFPAVLTTDEETFTAVQSLSKGDKITVQFIETAMAERIAVEVKPLTN